MLVSYNVLGQPISTIFKGQAVQVEKKNHHSVLCKVSKKLRSYLYHSGSMKSPTAIKTIELKKEK